MIADPAPRHLDAVAEVDLAADRVRFRLRDMIVATTVFSELRMVLFKLIRPVRRPICLPDGTSGYTVYLKQSRLPLNGRGQALAQRRILNDFLWGVCMPIVCLVFDPVVFRNFGPPLTDYSWSSLEGLAGALSDSLPILHLHSNCSPRCHLARCRLFVTARGRFFRRRIRGGSGNCLCHWTLFIAT